MTVSYTSKVTRARQFGCFIKLLARWRGSIYKLIWTDLLVFLALFFALSMWYHFGMNESQQKIFEKIAIYCEKYGSLIPISFVLGFYVSLVIGRWWQQYLSIPWPDTLAVWVNSNIRGDDEKDRILRRTLLRYACLSITQCFTLISPRVKKRFPTLEHLVEGGLLMEAEKEIIQEIQTTSSTGAKYHTHFIPLVWAAGIVTRARAENKIKNDGVVNILITEINKIKDSLNLLLSYDWISVPLVYTQVVTIAVYMYFLACLMGKQWIKSDSSSVANANGNTGSVTGTGDGSGSGLESEFAKLGIEALVVFFPFFTILQFFFYMGWLKVAESLLNPFGDDDDDFELNWIVDRHIQVSYLIVDEMCVKHPELLRDQYWEQVVPPELPHTVASEPYKDGPPATSTSKVTVSDGDAIIVSSPSVQGNLHLLGSKLDVREAQPTEEPAISASELRQLFGSTRVGSIDETQDGTPKASKLERIGSAVKQILSSSDRRRKSVESGESEEYGILVNISQGQGQSQSEARVHGTILEVDENTAQHVAEADIYAKESKSEDPETLEKLKKLKLDTLSNADTSSTEGVCSTAVPVIHNDGI